VYPPQITQYDQWGRRINNLETSEGWRGLQAISQREGLPGIFYERKYEEASRIYGFAKILLFMGDCHVVREILLMFFFFFFQIIEFFLGILSDQYDGRCR
jgi:hypothetical protein